ncbi:hypothetical protein D3C79_920920 [compost metagenome]
MGCSLLSIQPGSSSTQDGDIVGDPAIVGHAGTLALALGNRRAPEVNPVEVVDAVGLAALGSQQGVALTGGGHHGH